MTLKAQIRATRLLLGDALAQLDDLEARVAEAEADAPEWYTYATAAVYLGMTKAALYKAVQAGRIVPSGRNGRYVRFTKADLDTFLKGGR